MFDVRGIGKKGLKAYEFCCCFSWLQIILKGDKYVTIAGMIPLTIEQLMVSNENLSDPLNYDSCLFLLKTQHCSPLGSTQASKT